MQNKKLKIGFLLLIVAVVAAFFLLRTVPETRATQMGGAEAAVAEPAKAAVAPPAPAEMKKTGEPVAAEDKEVVLPGAALDPKKVEKIRSETKNHMAAVFVSQMSYFAETNRYTTDFLAPGYAPMLAEIKFKAGYLEPSRPGNFENEDPHRLNTDSLLGKKTPESDELYHYSAEAGAIDLQDFRSYCRRGCTADEKGFEMLMVVPLDKSHFDVWLINSDKEMALVHDGQTNRDEP